MILTNDILDEKDIKSFLIKLEQSLQDNQEYIEIIIEEAKSSDISIQEIDPFKNERDFLLHWFKYGFVIGKDILNKEECLSSINKIKEKLSVLNSDLHNQSTWVVDDNNTPIMSRGFFDLYHDDLLAQIRQNRKLYLYHVLLWQNLKLNTTFDRIGIKIKGIDGDKGLPLHVDQNPVVHPNFHTIQGVLALSDCTTNGTIVVPKSKNDFFKYKEYIPEGYEGEHVELIEDSELFNKMHSKKVYLELKQGNMLSWDSRTTHTNISNTSIDRFVMYTSTGIQIEEEKMRTKRIELFKNGNGENVRDAYCHASKKPRFSNDLNFCRKEEQLSELGRLLYGFDRYEDYLC